MSSRDGNNIGKFFHTSLPPNILAARLIETKIYYHGHKWGTGTSLGVRTSFQKISCSSQQIQCLFLHALSASPPSAKVKAKVLVLN